MLDVVDVLFGGRGGGGGGEKSKFLAEAQKSFGEFDSHASQVIIKSCFGGAMHCVTRNKGERLTSGERNASASPGRLIHLAEDQSNL